MPTLLYGSYVLGMLIVPVRLTNKCESNGRALANSWHYHDKDECYLVKTKGDVNVKVSFGRFINGS